MQQITEEQRRWEKGRWRSQREGGGGLVRLGAGRGEQTDLCMNSEATLQASWSSVSGVEAPWLMGRCLRPSSSYRLPSMPAAATVIRVRRERDHYDL